MYIYSGDCRLGECGDNTNMVDLYGKKLFVGDIVVTYTTDKFGVCNLNGITAVVSDRYTTFSDGTHKENNGVINTFVMGIQSVDFMKKEFGWSVQKIKDFNEVIDGEHWSKFGFNYREL